MSVTLTTAAAPSTQLLIVPADEAKLSIIADQLKSDNLPGALELCEMIQEIYSKNMAYLLLSLWHLGHYNIAAARNTLTQVHPVSNFDRHQVAKTSITKMISDVECYLRGESLPILSEDLIRDEFHYHPAILRDAVSQCIKNITDTGIPKHFLDHLAHAHQQSFSTTNSDTSSGVVWIET